VTIAASPVGPTGVAAVGVVAVLPPVPPYRLAPIPGRARLMSQVNCTPGPLLTFCQVRLAERNEIDAFCSTFWNRLFFTVTEQEPTPSFTAKTWLIPLT